MASLGVEEQIATLLEPLSENEQRSYYAQRLPTGIDVQYAGKDSKGKRLVATQAFREGQLLLAEAPLVAGQHTANKAEALVCAQCFRYLGSIEQQIVHRLQGNATDTSGDHTCGGGAGPTTTGASSAESPLDEDTAALVCQLAEGKLQLPHSGHLQLPDVRPCRGGCGEVVYCSGHCEAEAWKGHHQLLCLGNGSREVDADGALDLTSPAHALWAFKQHADATNDILHVAAQAVAATALAAEQLLQEGTASTASLLAQRRWLALQQAWRPLQAGWKRIWWTAVACPPDVDDEAAFREEIKGLAEESLALLRAALPAQADAFPALFSLPVYGSIIGMFELNNLALVVPSLLEIYFLLLDGLAEPERSEAMEVGQPLLDALGASYDAHVEGTAFYALQSCMNHSCAPNAHALKDDQDVTGHAVIRAARAIQPGEELCISYIDEAADYEERQAALADYGFVCGCSRCLAEGKRAV